VNSDPFLYSDPVGEGPVGAAIGRQVGGWVAGVLGSETGPFDVAIALGGRYLGGLAGDTLEDWTVSGSQSQTDPVPDSVAMSKGGNRNIANEYSRAAVTEAQASGKDPCDLLDDWYKEAKAEGDTEATAKIVTAQKALGCRNRKKRCQ